MKELELDRYTLEHFRHKGRKLKLATERSVCIKISDARRRLNSSFRGSHHIIKIKKYYKKQTYLLNSNNQFWVLRFKKWITTNRILQFTVLQTAVDRPRWRAIFEKPYLPHRKMTIFWIHTVSSSWLKTQINKLLGQCLLTSLEAVL